MYGDVVINSIALINKIKHQLFQEKNIKLSRKEKLGVIKKGKIYFSH